MWGPLPRAAGSKHACQSWKSGSDLNVWGSCGFTPSGTGVLGITFDKKVYFSSHFFAVLPGPPPVNN